MYIAMQWRGRQPTSEQIDAIYEYMCIVRALIHNKEINKYEYLTEHLIK